jgi:hypothetical protein
MPPISPRDLIRNCPDLRERERRRLLALDDWVLQKLHTEWTLPHATTARVAAGLRDDHVSFDNVKHYRVVLEGRRAPTQSAEQTAARKAPPSGEERRRGHVESKNGVSDTDVVLHQAPDPAATYSDASVVESFRVFHSRNSRHHDRIVRRASSKR